MMVREKTYMAHLHQASSASDLPFIQSIAYLHKVPVNAINKSNAHAIMRSGLSCAVLCMAALWKAIIALVGEVDLGSFRFGLLK